jgi:hypothetical protein
MAIKTDTEILSTSRERIVNSAKATAALPITVVLSGGSAADIFIGGPDVTAANGYPVGQNTLTLLLGPGDDLWAIAGSGTPTISVLSTRGAATGAG